MIAAAYTTGGHSTYDPCASARDNPYVRAATAPAAAAHASMHAASTPNETASGSRANGTNAHAAPGRYTKICQASGGSMSACVPASDPAATNTRQSPAP